MLTYVPGWQEAYLWVVVVAFIVAFVLAFSMGGNDCANSYGTSVGSKVLKLWQAYILATVFETLGAGLLGYKVTDTIRKNIVNLDIYTVYSQQTVNGTWDIVDSCSNYSSLATPSSWHNYSGNTTDFNLPCNDYTSVQFLLGALGSLGGCAVWLLIATLLRLPVSATHSAIGATVGFSLVLKGGNGINWFTILKIVVSWVVSPLLAGFFATLFYIIIKYLILNKKNPLEASLTFLPFIFMFALTINLFSICYQGSKYLHLDNIEWWIVLLIALGIGVTVALLVRIFVTNRLRHWVLTTHKIPGIVSVASISIDNIDTVGVESSTTVLDDMGASSPPTIIMTESTSVIPMTPRSPVDEADSDSRNSSFTDAFGKIGENDAKEKSKSADSVDPISLKQRLVALKHPTEEHPHVSKVFISLQVLSACFMSFSHGSNDTANAIGMLVAIWFTFDKGNAMGGDSTDAELELLILFGVAGMIIGLWLIGHKVIETVGENITKITPCSGFCMEFGTSFTVLVASKIGIPVSTTHCLVGAVVCVGWFKTRKGVSWKTFGNIALSWLITLPVTGALSALFAYLLQFASG